MKHLNVILLFILISACSKDDEIYPRHYVNFKIYLNDARYTPLKAIGNSLIINSNEVLGESQCPNGIIIYRYSDYEFKAFDNYCTYEPQYLYPLTVQNAIANCSHCGSNFLLATGDPSEGVANMTLTEFSVSYSGTELFVSN